jgi:hypothetical protein
MVVDITFLFRTNQTNVRQYGKIALELSDDHEGVDIHIRSHVIQALNSHMINTHGPNIQDIQISILCLLTEFCGPFDKDLFDLYVDVENGKYTYYGNSGTIYTIARRSVRSDRSS